MYVVFWLSTTTVADPGWSTQKLGARFKMFDDEKKAKKFYDEMFLRALKGELYQSRVPSNITKSW